FLDQRCGFRKSHRLCVQESLETSECRRLFLNFLFAPFRIELDYFRMTQLGAFIGQYPRKFGRAFDAALSELFVEGSLNFTQLLAANRLTAQTMPFRDDERLFAAWQPLTIIHNCRRRLPCLNTPI